MASPSPSELSLDCKPHTYSMLLKSFEDHDQTNSQKLEDFLSRLEEERLKIDAFKRELPLSMQLLTTAVEASRQQLQAYRANQGTTNRPVLEEFIPLKHSISEGSEKTTNSCDKANWMTSAQLWSQATSHDHNIIATKPQSTTISSPKEPVDLGFNVTPKLALADAKQHQRSYGGGAFLPFSKDRNSSPPGPTTLLRPLPELALASSAEVINNKAEIFEDKTHHENGNIANCDQQGGKGITGNSTPEGHANTTASTAAATTTTQTHRKARRCWSPDLHRRFVNALQMLGGSQVATPKQIRELMKVDGLTNDEVKSHLQKYRLHTRRPSPSPQASGAPTPQLVVLGGIWVPPEYAAAHSGSTALYSPHPGSHAPTHHYCATPMTSQDFYSAAAAPPPLPSSHHQLHHHTLQHQLHVYRRSASHTQSSTPESDLHRGPDDRSESIEDGKSESSSWKGGESGENNGGEKNGLGARREDGEESNGSQITLKF